MVEMTLPDMTCEFCAQLVAQTCKLVDPSAKVEADIGARTIRIETKAPHGRLAHALAYAGYPPAKICSS